MIFTIEAASFLRNVESVVRGIPKPETESATLRIIACQGQVYVKVGESASAMEAVVWEDGQCTVSPAAILSLMKTYRHENVTIDADGQGLRVRGSFMPVRSYCSWALAPGVGASLAATD